MKKTIIIPAVILFGLLFASNVLAEDTGTYQIQAYEVVLTPHFNGDIEMYYSQKWLVTGGHIPWVTVGMPNSNYEVRDFGGAAAKVAADNGGGWDGVRVDLDKDYQDKETFQFNFSAVQHGLLESTGNGSYRLRFTPGWYDRAFIDALRVTVLSPAKIEELKIDPPPDSISRQDIIWTRKLGKGEKFTVSVTFPNGTYNRTAIEQQSVSGYSTWIILLFVGIIAVFVVFALIGISNDSNSSYSGSSGSYYSESLEERRRRKKKDEDDDDYHTPAIYAGGSKGSSSSHESGGGGGFGGRGTSCVCACVSCACACACAGGGGAGCAPKHKHSCPKCQLRKVKEDEQEK